MKSGFKNSMAYFLGPHTQMLHFLSLSLSLLKSFYNNSFVFVFILPNCDGWDSTTSI